MEGSRRPVYDLWNDQAFGAEPVLRECLSIREKAPKKDDRRIAEPDAGHDSKAVMWRAKVNDMDPTTQPK